MARRLPREPGVRAAPAWRSPEKAGRRPSSGRGGGRAAAASRDGPSGAVDTTLASPGGAAPAPALVAAPQPGRTGPNGADARGPRRPRPVSPRVSRGGGHSGPGKRPAPARRPAARPSCPAGAPRPLRSRPLPLRQARASPRLWGAAASLAAPTYTSLGPPRARTPTPTRSAPALSGRSRSLARAPRARAPLAARSRGRTLWPRARALDPLGSLPGG